MNIFLNLLKNFIKYFIIFQIFVGSETGELEENLLAVF